MSKIHNKSSRILAKKCHPQLYSGSLTLSHRQSRSQNTKCSSLHSTPTPSSSYCPNCYPAQLISWSSRTASPFSTLSSRKPAASDSCCFSSLKPFASSCPKLSASCQQGSKRASWRAVTWLDTLCSAILPICWESPRFSLSNWRKWSKSARQRRRPSMLLCARPIGQWAFSAKTFSAIAREKSPSGANERSEEWFHSRYSKDKYWIFKN